MRVTDSADSRLTIANVRSPNAVCESHQGPTLSTLEAPSRLR